MLALIRWAFLFMSLGLIILMIGPFQGAESSSGVSDKFAHVVAFALITAAAFLNLPRLNRIQIAGLALGVGIAVEIIQGLTGRDADVRDVIADGIGILLMVIVWRGRNWWSPQSAAPPVWRDRRP